MHEGAVRFIYIDRSPQGMDKKLPGMVSMNSRKRLSRELYNSESQSRDRVVRVDAAVHVTRQDESAATGMKDVAAIYDDGDQSYWSPHQCMAKREVDKLTNLMDEGSCAELDNAGSSWLFRVRRNPNSGRMDGA